MVDPMMMSEVLKMREDISDLKATSIPIGATIRAALMVAGEIWPTDIPVWTCSHRHKVGSEALACAEDELRSRLDESGALKDF